jgi:hypothetical protein
MVACRGKFFSPRQSDEFRICAPLLQVRMFGVSPLGGFCPAEGRLKAGLQTYTRNFLILVSKAIHQSKGGRGKAGYATR